MEDLRTPRRLNFHPLESDIVTFPPSLLILAEILTLLAQLCSETAIGLSEKTAARRSGGKTPQKSSAVVKHITPVCPRVSEREGYRIVRQVAWGARLRVPHASVQK
jgi:hypothetical protein